MTRETNGETVTPEIEPEVEAAIEFFRHPKETYTAAEIAPMAGIPAEEVRTGFLAEHRIAGGRIHRFPRAAVLEWMLGWDFVTVYEALRLMHGEGVATVDTGEMAMMLLRTWRDSKPRATLHIDEEATAALDALVWAARQKVRHGDSPHPRIMPTRDSVTVDLIQKAHEPLGAGQNPGYLAEILASRLIEMVNDCVGDLTNQAGDMLKDIQEQGGSIGPRGAEGRIA